MNHIFNCFQTICDLFATKFANDNPIVTRFAELLMRATQGAAQAQCLLQLVGCMAEKVADHFKKKLGWIKGMLNNTREDIRELVAQLYSIVAATCQLDEFERVVDDLGKSFKDKHLEYQTGCIIAVGFSFARFFMVSKDHPTMKKVREWTCFKKMSELIIDQLDHSHQLMLGSACLSIGELGRCTELPLQNSGQCKCSLNLTTQFYSSQIPFFKVNVLHSFTALKSYNRQQ